MARYAQTNSPTAIDEWVRNEFDELGDSVNGLYGLAQAMPLVKLSSGSLQVSWQTHIITINAVTLTLKKEPSYGRFIRMIKHSTTGTTTVVMNADDITNGWTWDDGSTSAKTYNTKSDVEFIALTDLKIWLVLS